MRFVQSRSTDLVALYGEVDGSYMDGMLPLMIGGHGHGHGHGRRELRRRICIVQCTTLCWIFMDYPPSNLLDKNLHGETT